MVKISIKVVNSTLVIAPTNIEKCRVFKRKKHHFYTDSERYKSG